MKNIRSIWRLLIEAGALLLFVAVLSIIFANFRNSNPYVASSDTAAPQLSPTARRNDAGQAALFGSPYPPPYPPPGSSMVTPSGLPVNVEAVARQAYLLQGNKIALIDGGNIWVVRDERAPEMVVDKGDISAIFGWSQDGSMLLFGRGLYPTESEMSDSAGLWLYEDKTGEIRQLADSTKVWSAGWSPVDDRIAYCEYGDVVSIISIEGELLHQQPELLCDFNWSPDGSALAVQYHNTKMVASDGAKLSALAVWYIDPGKLQLMSEATCEYHSGPIWSLDGARILFRRSFSELCDEAGLNGLYEVDIASGKISYLDHSPKLYASNYSRSPRADILAFQLGKDIYVMTLGDDPEKVSVGGWPIWLTDGTTLVNYNSGGNLAVNSIETQVSEGIVGGGQNSYQVHIQPELFITKEDANE